ncbi:hypothetical protein C2G38_2144238 [Gigaspora rosea]|uniref:Uncharacterized protein n=1 Tax=Gigaspora rosea TaxID=44941 RepID=A0A397UVB1_9GLOM|nr:hypothetical protein C2G38_2144238 [Gigaspora rosea]
MMKIGGCSAVFLSLLALVLVLLSFVGINPEVPKQAPYRFTGYLSWLPKQEGSDDNMLDAATLFNIITMIIASYYALKWAYNPPTNPKLITHFYSADDNDVASSPTIDFNRVLAIYIVTTLLAGAVLFFVGAGKIWVAVGVFHNASEFIILIMLGSGGKIKSSTFWPILGFYIFIISITCILFKFPYDALWFKGQGLCFDWALIIEFTRIYLTTLHELKHGGANHDDLDELIENEDDSSQHKSIIHHPHQLLLLIFGAFFHLIGNFVFTIFLYSFYA